jgi:hypothetical protein
MSLGGRRTAKPKIQIRQYLTQQSKKMQHHCDPFLPEDDDARSRNLLHPKIARFTFRTSCVPDNESAPFDDILTSKINPDEVNRFIAALRMPAGRPVAKLFKLRVFTSAGLATFRAESEKLDQMKFADAQDPPEEDDRALV